MTDKHGADGRSPLHDAAADGDADAIRQLVADGCNPNVADSEGWTPLHFAAQSHHVASTMELLDAGARVDARDVHGNTPLARAVFTSRGRGDVIQLLRRAGADPLAVNAVGISPVALAKRIANYDVSRFFADVDDAHSAPAS